MTFSRGIPSLLPSSKIWLQHMNVRADFRSLRNEFRCLRIAVTANGGDERKSDPANWQCDGTSLYIAWI